jgi:hypothetical protein
MWSDGEMYVRLHMDTREGPDEGPQPNVALYFPIHDWEAIVSTAASKRRELELRSFSGDSDNTNLV